MNGFYSSELKSMTYDKLKGINSQFLFVNFELSNNFASRKKQNIIGPIAQLVRATDS